MTPEGEAYPTPPSPGKNTYLYLYPGYFYKVYRYLGYCTTGVQNSQNFGVLHGNRTELTEVSGTAFDFLAESTEVSGIVWM